MQSRSWAKSAAGYALATACVLVALLLTRVLRGFGDSGVSPLFFAAVLVAAWWGGFGPGLLATFLSDVATANLLMDGHGASRTIGQHLLRLGVFSVVAVLASSLHEAMRRAALALRQAREAAESASQAKSKFLAMVSHELRTPLSPVLMLCDMLERDPSLPPALLRDVQAIRRNVDLEIRLIEDLVDLTRINVGKLRLEMAEVDALAALNAAIDVCRDDIREKQLELKLDLSAARATVLGDAVRLRQIFWNLIRNAVKFTPDGGTISVVARDGSAGTLDIEISDNGIGIAPEQLSRIFTAFEQGEPDIQIRFGGLGLGLAICHALVEAHHGTICAASAGKGRGASFSVTLPLIAEKRDALVGDGAQSRPVATA